MAGKQSEATKADAYVCVVGIDHDYGHDEPGAPFTGPKRSVEWLLRDGHIVKAEEAA